MEDLYRALSKVERLDITDCSGFSVLYGSHPLVQPWGTPVCPRLDTLLLDRTSWSKSEALNVAQATSPEKTAEMLRECVSSFVEVRPVCVLAEARGDDPAPASGSDGGCAAACDPARGIHSGVPRCSGSKELRRDAGLCEEI